MFSEEILEQIFADQRGWKIPICYQHDMIHIVCDVLERNRYLSNDEKEIIEQTNELRKENDNV